MLDKSKLMRQLQEVTDKLFLDTSAEFARAYELWQQICSDPLVREKMQAVDAQWLMPTWQGQLDEVVAIEPRLESYTVAALDGSQIYPDRHQGTSCYLINIGSVVLEYGAHPARVQFNSTPSVYVGEDEDGLEISTDVVNCRRQELEFVQGLAVTRELKKKNEPGHPLLFLFDGSLIFWHLESKEMDLKNTFLSRYLASLYLLQKEHILAAGYISLPKNKELVNLLRVALCNYELENCVAYKEIDHVIDTSIASFYIPPYHRSTIFKNHASICKQYPEDLHPHFFYLNIGTEIGRVEIPAWIARDAAAVNTICQIILDQSLKGRGYPVGLAEAHEQAVVKGPDREFFYQLIAKIGMECKQRITVSQKSMKKRQMGV